MTSPRRRVRLLTRRGYRRVLGVSSIDSIGARAGRWIRGVRQRERPVVDYLRLRWCREVTTTYRLTARCSVPTELSLLARISVVRLENVPSTGLVIRAANHFVDNFTPIGVCARSRQYPAKYAVSDEILRHIQAFLSD
jgi:hypothetical protein